VSLELLPRVNEGLDILLLLIDLLLECLLVGLLSEPASDSRLSILQSLSGLLVFDWVVEIRVGAIFIVDRVLEILLFLVGQLLDIDGSHTALIHFESLIATLKIVNNFDLVGEFDGG